jgi:transcriptional regulator with XRE-family HTH domain
MNVISVKALAHLVKEERRSRGWTQAELAKRAGVSRDWMIGLEKAKPSVELALVLRTLKALELSLTASPSSPAVSPSSRYLDSLKSHNTPQNTHQGDED